MKKKYRWNKAKFANTMLELATMVAVAGLFVWLTCTWILTA